MPWRRKWQPTPVFLLGNPMDRGAWWATVQFVTKAKSRTWLSTHWTGAWNYMDFFLEIKGLCCFLFSLNRNIRLYSQVLFLVLTLWHLGEHFYNPYFSNKRLELFIHLLSSRFLSNQCAGYRVYSIKMLHTFCVLSLYPYPCLFLKRMNCDIKNIR